MDKRTHALQVLLGLQIGIIGANTVDQTVLNRMIIIDVYYSNNAH